jgi:hypothetical protein
MRDFRPVSGLRLKLIAFPDEGPVAWVMSRLAFTVARAAQAWRRGRLPDSRLSVAAESRDGT